MENYRKEGGRTQKGIFKHADMPGPFPTQGCFNLAWIVALSTVRAKEVSLMGRGWRSQNHRILWGTLNPHSYLPVSRDGWASQGRMLYPEKSSCKILHPKRNREQLCLFKAQFSSQAASGAVQCMHCLLLWVEPNGSIYLTKSKHT